MTDDTLARRFAAGRPRMLRVAYAILGEHAESEDVVQDCWLRLVDADRREPIKDVEAWATVAVSRRALDVLRSARVRRESYVGPWLPEPAISALGTGQARPLDPADQVSLDETVSYALLVVLETLTPAERTAWVLHDLFGMPFAEVADVVGRTPAAVRQLASRARAHVAERVPRVSVDTGDHRRLVEAFAFAAGTGDLHALLDILDPDVVLTSDGGGEVSAARRPIAGADRVARFVVGIARKFPADLDVQVVDVNGAPGLFVASGEASLGVAVVGVAGGRIRRIDFILAPAKLRRVGLPG